MGPKSKIMNFLQGRKEDIEKTVSGVAFGASDFAPSVRNLLKKYGNNMVQEMTVGRTPVASGITTAINIVSQGGFKKNQDELKYERLFHLFVNLRLEGNIKLRLEKNEVITLSDGWNKEAEGQYEPIDVNKQVSLGQLLTNTKNQMGPQFFSYDSASNNCQDFILNVLTSNGLGNDTNYAFIKQDTESLFKNLDKTKFIAKAVTEFGARFNIATQGGYIANNEAYNAKNATKGKGNKISTNNIMPHKKLLKGSPEAKAFMASIRAKRMKGGQVSEDLKENAGDNAEILMDGMTQKAIEKLKLGKGIKGRVVKKGKMLMDARDDLMDEIDGGNVSKSLKRNAGKNTQHIMDALVEKAVEKLKIKGGTVSKDLKVNAGANTSKLLDALVAKTIEKLKIKGGTVSEGLKENAGENAEILMDGMTQKAIEKLKLKGGKLVMPNGDVGMGGYGVTIHQHHHHHYGSKGMGLEAGMGLKAGEGVNRLKKANRWTGFIGDTYQGVAQAVKPVAKPIFQAGTDYAVEQINPETPEDYFSYYMM